ncbi:hypothetical protein [Arthrobacter agilis]|uniref:hypothetical protein n=1 Tax=Arthrobacter agilis TaxID=37921 RepID=UPI0027813E95|nr:hypothetical protein [Arthrobacter agilis]MDQ0734660.1 hypothetical protein [Arthrobacter agilis]
MEELAGRIFDDAEILINRFSGFLDNSGGLHHKNVPGNEGTIRRLATKHGPLPDIFKPVFLANPTMSGLLPASGTTEILVKLDSSQDRIDTLLAVASFRPAYAATLPVTALAVITSWGNHDQPLHVHRRCPIRRRTRPWSHRMRRGE